MVTCIDNIVLFRKKLEQVQINCSLEKFNQFPKPFNEISIEDIKKKSQRFNEFGIDEKLIDWVHFIIFLTKVNLNLENKQKALDLIIFAKEKEIERFSGTINSPLMPRIEQLIRDCR